MTGQTTGFPVEGGSELRRQPTTLSRRAALLSTLQAVIGLAACTGPLPRPLVIVAPAAGTGQASQAASPAPLPLTRNASCAYGLPTVVPPTPLPYPGYAQQEPETGLHVTGPAQPVDFASYRLEVRGLVDQPLNLSYDDLRCLPKVQARVQLVCPGFFGDLANLAGASLAGVIALAGPGQDATEVTLSSVDGHSARFSLSEARAAENFLAYEWEGKPLPASHGFPLRAALPGKTGSDWVKWLVKIELS